MATKKYISLERLDQYDDKIKKYLADADAAALQSAKDYANGLAGNYEAAGSVNTAKEALQKNIDAVQANVDTVSAANVATQGEVDALETYVGTFTHATAKSVVEYVDAKTAGIATEGAMTALDGRVTAVEGAVDAIEADYLKAEDKTELSDAIAAEATRADTAEKANAAAIKAISDDYLKAADKTALQGSIDGVAGDVADIVADYLKSTDKTELQGKIDAKVAQADYDAKMEEIDGDIDGLQTQINTIMNNPDAEGAINSINEFTQYIADHGEIADGFRTDINKNKDDIAAEVNRAGEAEAALSGRIDTLEAIDHDAYVAADTALKTELEGKINAKADASALTAAVEALEGADAGQVSRIEALEAKFTGDDSVADMIADAKQEAIDSAVGTAAADATSKANKALEDAKAYADAEDAKIETRVDALETASAGHAAAADLTALAGRVTTAEGKVGTLETEMDAVEAKAAANETAIGTLNTNVAKKADQTALDGVSGRVTTLEAWHESFTEASESEINALFA